ncbi:hypothetical protein PGT21_018103 [Puccinia graminis f. sp. tritici]|uniref:Uncharacterized protein n=1 Tax=Puccinia graminis f. sp. tritici TaxID=56615 RepID=A0A5B0NKD9_PUCGR|nr:hypothetical protein PGT21_018103 [Puccinia graminis f. sp. tritici]KAA1089785.1 hypothetical protein PGTUg99_011145 [Puccinia graminis f. sp. tritici]
MSSFDMRIILWILKQIAGWGEGFSKTNMGAQLHSHWAWLGPQVQQDWIKSNQSRSHAHRQVYHPAGDPLIWHWNIENCHEQETRKFWLLHHAQCWRLGAWTLHSRRAPKIDKFHHKSMSNDQGIT